LSNFWAVAMADAQQQSVIALVFRITLRTCPQTSATLG
jgi:hypothetical protein